MSGHTLRLEHLGKHFGGLQAVEDVSAEALSGEILGIIGQNGAGKTTVFNLVAGTLPSSGGRVVLGDDDLTSQSAWQRSRKGIARTFQIPKPVWSLTVRENVQLGLVAHGHTKPESARLADVKLEELGLSNLANEGPESLSPGQLRLLEFARASVVTPRVLLLDEVFAGLTVAEQQATVEVIRRIKARNVVVVWIEHNVQLMLSLADTVMVMDRGRKIAHDVPRVVAEDARVIEAYLGLAKGEEEA